MRLNVNKIKQREESAYHVGVLSFPTGIHSSVGTMSLPENISSRQGGFEYGTAAKKTDCIFRITAGLQSNSNRASAPWYHKLGEDKTETVVVVPVVRIVVVPVGATAVLGIVVPAAATVHAVRAALRQLPCVFPINPP